MNENDDYLYIVKVSDSPLKDRSKDRLRREVIRLRAKTADLEALLDGRSAEAYQYFKEMEQANRELTGKITQHEQTLIALKKSEQMYRELFDTIRDFVFTHDLDGYFITVNPALAARLGLSLKGITERRITDFIQIQDQEDFKDTYLNELQENKFTKGIFKLEIADGSIHYMEYSSTLVERKRHKPYASVSGRDVTERILAESKLRDLQKQLNHAQKMEAVGTLASGIAHDFNNILQAISGYIELIKAQQSMTTPVTSYLLEIESAVDHAATLVRRLLTFGRKVESQYEATDLNQSIIQSVQLLQRTIPKMITIETDLAEDLKMIYADPYKIEQILLNLGTNAKDAIHGDGVIEISTSNVTLTEDECSGEIDLKAGDYIMIKFSDNGSGMDQITLQRIFDPFFSTKAVGHGTGLGLYTVYGLVKDHGGQISCDSLQGVGTTFKIMVPAMDDHSFEKTELIAAEHQIRGGEETILVVDDERAILQTTQDFLHLYGYSTISAATGEEAIRIFKRNQQGIDLVILDLSMPGMGGLACLREIRVFNPVIKILISSGYIEDGIADDLWKLGISGFIKKPYRMAEFIHMVRMALDSTPGQSVAPT
jgi:two-component system cell cycle sensor histidine kinase/response regulator CckA